MSDTDLVDSTSLNDSPAFTVAPSVGHLHVHDVAERVLRVVSDADADTITLDLHPFVVGRVAQILGHVHGR